MLSNQLHMFKHKGPELWNFRCPYCNDSTKSKSKTRGYIYNKNGRYVFYCHNCNSSRSLEQFLREQNSELYRDFNNERFNLTKEQIEKDYTKMIKKIYLDLDGVLANFESRYFYLFECTCIIQS